MATTPKKGDAAQPKKARAPRNTKKYVRNLYYVPLHIKLNDDGARMVLSARGQRGDIRELTKDDESNFRILNNINLTLQVLSQAEAQAVLRGQYTNAQATAGINPLVQQLQNPMNRNASYDQDDVPLTHERASEGETVALIDKDYKIIEDGYGNTARPERSVGPRVAGPSEIAGSDAEMQAIMQERNEDIANSTDLTSALGHFTFED